ncbi:protein of unknown function [Cardinium endosymbiont cEper1 of Encarsia pergandiella]|nr:protein of unknown function [Cardinium endosymbiont cEper1 of Encarsia pergandiella]
MAEWFNATVLKTVVLLKVPRVRIPHPPHIILMLLILKTKQYKYKYKAVACYFCIVTLQDYNFPMLQKILDCFCSFFDHFVNPAVA